MPQSVISLEQLTVRRGQSTILHNVNLHLAPAQHCAMLGPNGAGKTTLLQVISGYLWPTRGSISVLGESFGQTDLNQLRRRIGLLSQAILDQFAPLMISRNIVYTGLLGTLLLTKLPTPDQRDHAQQLIEEFALSKVIDSPFGRLSAGERQRVLIVRALMNDPAQLILDEPAAGMDLPGREALLVHIEKLAHMKNAPTLLMVTHHISEITPAFSKVLLLKNGSVLACGEKNAILTEQNISQLYGLPVKLEARSGRYWPQI